MLDRLLPMTVTVIAGLVTRQKMFPLDLSIYWGRDDEAKDWVHSL